ncbi:uncharacterized zinc finger CCHC domain-containing protein At4g19190 [Euphorbia lathyris]|uniref:uncharacterized zinc finger CCHC domain-containing protein At4g19190 n=1 Tax=Euphorbia lathyris TaxID=212925 RepID=UPI003313AB5F
MEGEEGEGLRLSKRINDGEVDYKTKSGTAWSHSYLNQKPWHPLSYPNQRRKWIAEQTNAQRERRAEEVAREYAQEQEFFRQAALISKKEKEKIEMMKAVSFMYVRPPGYNAESAKAAEIADERKKEELDDPFQKPLEAPPEASSTRDPSGEEKKKSRPRDVFGRTVPTEEEFEVLKNAPRLETGVAARAKPFAVEVRNVKCIRCSNFGHQSGDRECPLKDAIMPNEESRLKRDDPLTAIIAQTDPTEPLKWELKQKPGMSPPRGGFRPDDPNQQIVAEDIFDEYGGFLSGDIPQLLTTFSPAKSVKKTKKSKKPKHRRDSSPSGKLKSPEENGSSSPSDNEEKRSKNKRKKKANRSESSLFHDLKFDRHTKSSRHKRAYSSDDFEYGRHHQSEKSRQKYAHSSEDSDIEGHHTSTSSRKKHLSLSERSSSDRHRRIDKKQKNYRHSSDDSDLDRKHRSKHRHHH